MSKLTRQEIDQRQTLKNVMENDMFSKAMDDVRREVADQILRSNDPAERERLYFEGQLINRMQARLESYANDLLFVEKPNFTEKPKEFSV